jgi:hypothetical protein
MPRSMSPRANPSRRSPTLAATLTAAALAGELVVATLVVADDAHAHVDEPRAPETSVTPVAERLEPPTPEAPDRPPVEAPVDVPGDVPVDVPPPLPPERPPPLPPELPAAPPPELPAAAVPEVPSAPIAPVRSSVRTGHTAGAPVANPTSAIGETAPAPRTARAGDDDHDEPAIAAGPRRTGRDDRAPEAPPSGRGGRAPAEHQRPRRRGAPQPATGVSAVEGALPAQHTIVPGEHLWGIAARRLGELTGRDPASIPAEDVAPYWTRVCMTNAPHLRSGNVSLVYPGEVIELPPSR